MKVYTFVGKRKSYQKGVVARFLCDKPQTPRWVFDFDGKRFEQDEVPRQWKIERTGKYYLLRQKNKKRHS